ncbi:MAG TPA: twin-arginine translocase TatA/TatE family subunit [Pyrinomonadaceae bacterium]
MHCLLFLEFIGTTELLVVLLVALVVFGPRKLPELGRSLGRALGQLQAASEDFKGTWEVESRVDVGVRSRPARPLTPEALPEGLAAERLSQE